MHPTVSNVVVSQTVSFAWTPVAKAMKMWEREAGFNEDVCSDKMSEGECTDTQSSQVAHKALIDT